MPDDITLPCAPPDSPRAEYKPRPKTQIICATCGETKLTHFPASKYCSQACRNARPNRQTATKARAKAKRAAERTARPTLVKPDPSSSLRYRGCQQCGSLMIGNMNRKYCGDQCRINNIAHRMMGLYNAAIGVREIPTAMHWHRQLCGYLAGRDGVGCGICSKPVDLTLKSGTRGSDLGASIDHVIPRSKGGSDDLSNLRLTHWGCNRKRGNRGVVEQLRLVG